MGEGKGVPNIADQTVTDSCDHLSAVAVHRDSGRGTQASISDDSFQLAAEPQTKW